MEIYERVHTNMFILRSYLGLSQLDASKLAGITPSTYCQIESGERDGRLDVLEAIAVKSFGISLVGLIESDLTSSTVERAVKKYKISDGLVFLGEGI